MRRYQLTSALAQLERCLMEQFQFFILVDEVDFVRETGDDLES